MDNVRLDQLMDEVRRRLRQGDRLGASSLLLRDESRDISDWLATLAPADVRRLLADSNEAAAADLLSHLDPEVAGRWLLEVDQNAAARILDRLPADQAIRILEDCGGQKSAALLALMEHGASIRAQMSAYPPGTAGRLMSPEPFSVAAHHTAAEAIGLLRSAIRSAIEGTTYFHVVDERHRLVGVTSVRHVLEAAPDTGIAEFMHSEVISVSANATWEQCEVLVHRHHILSLPVVDETNRLIGVIRSDRLVHMRDERVGLDLLGVLGVTRLRPAESVASTVRHRLPWLMVNLITVLLAASVVGLFQGTIESVVALAIFLPVLAGHGANTGMQTVAVMVRTLATVELGHRGWLRIMRHELAAASVHGIVIGVLVGIGGGLWSGSATFGLVVASGALAATLMAGLTGTLIPMALHAVRQDPSSGSGVVVTTFTDMTGFFVMLGLGTLLIGRLV